MGAKYKTVRHHKNVNQEHVRGHLQRLLYSEADMLICRDLVNHLATKDVQRLLRNLRDSGTKYLARTVRCLVPNEWNDEWTNGPNSRVNANGDSWSPGPLVPRPRR